MADMDETGQTTNFDEDPAAAFLAREQDDLEGITDDALAGSGSGSETLMFGGPSIAAPTGEGILFSDDSIRTEEPVQSSDPYSAITHMDETPDCIRKWKVEQEEMLCEKDSTELANLDELRALAQKELQDWYAHYDDQLKHTKDSNRQAEEAFVEERDEDIPGHEWERIARMCDFNPKNNKNTKDVSRMRSMFLQLKQTPPVH